MKNAIIVRILKVWVAVFLIRGAAYWGPHRWVEVWKEDFSGPAGSIPDSSKWVFDRGATGWGNHGLEEYVDSTDNVSLDGHGHLMIRAIRSASGHYTSGRIRTQEKFEVRYGKIEARIRIARGQGIWPAFWMPGKDISSAEGRQPALPAEITSWTRLAKTSKRRIFCKLNEPRTLPE